MVTGTPEKASVKKPAAAPEEGEEAGNSDDESDAAEVADSLEYSTLKDHRSTLSSLLRPSNLPALVEIDIAGGGITADVLFKVEQCGDAVSSGWLLRSHLCKGDRCRRCSETFVQRKLKTCPAPLQRSSKETQVC